MKIAVINAKELDPGLIAKWSELQNGNPAFANPFFSPHYTTAVAAVRDDVYVGLMQEGPNVVGFFPFQRGRLGVGRPVGLRMSDYQAVIVADGMPWTAEELIRGCRLSIWDFDHLLASQSEFTPYCHEVADSPIMDLSGGYEGYEEARREIDISQVRDTGRRMRKLEREIGPCRFDRQVTDRAILRQLMEWKTKQSLRTGTVTYFQIPWIVELIERVLTLRAPNFSSVLSALYVEEKLLAVQFYMCTRNVWHFWIMASADEYSIYSPGMILLLDMAKTAASQGSKCIDFGKGMLAFKKHFMTNAIVVAEGSVQRPSLASMMRNARNRTERAIRGSPLEAIARIPGRLIKRMERRNRYV